MIILDTDHVSILKYREHPRAKKLKEKLIAAAANETLATTIVSAEEQMRGWMAEIHRERDVHKQVQYYSELSGIFAFFSTWRVELFDESAAEEFYRLRGMRIRVATQDLKIASIARSRDALLLSANLRDFARVPDLRVENWVA